MEFGTDDELAITGELDHQRRRPRERVYAPPRPAGRLAEADLSGYNPLAPLMAFKETIR